MPTNTSIYLLATTSSSNVTNEEFSTSTTLTARFTSVETTTTGITSALSVTAAPASVNVALIAGVVGGGIVLLALVGVAVAVGMHYRRRKAGPNNELPLSVTTSTSVATPAKDTSPQRFSEYGPISGAIVHGEYGVAPPAKEGSYGPMSAADVHGEFASMRADGQYANAAAALSTTESPYSSTAVDFTTGLPTTTSNYQAFTPT